MKVWLDALTPKQILFAQPLTLELERRRHETTCTSRHYREVEGLVAKLGLKAHFVGQHGGSLLLEKLKASAQRIQELSDLVSEWKPDCAVSFASPECARVSFGLGIKHLSITDSPHAESVCRLTLPLSQALLTPWIIPYSAWARYGLSRRQIVTYRALDPAAWLKRRSLTERRSELEIDLSKRCITVRVEESSASYLLGRDENWSLKVIDALASNFPDCNIVVLCRYGQQIEAVLKRYGSRVIVPEQVFDGVTVAKASDVFIGMGGTMTAEAALLGVPTVSAFQGGRLYTEDYLERHGLLFRPRGIEASVSTVREMLRDHQFRSRLEAKAERMLAKMEDPVLKVVQVVERLNR